VYLRLICYVKRSVPYPTFSNQPIAPQIFLERANWQTRFDGIDIMNTIAERNRRSSQASAPNPEAADQLLETMGYKPELIRNRSTFQVAFMSFVLASIPYGLATSLTYPLSGGGPVNVIWGWILVSLIVFCVAASLGEITSVYPTAGGTYHVPALYSLWLACFLYTP
jgi:amino acid permease